MMMEGSNQTSQTVSDGLSVTNVDELRKSVPPGKRLTEGRQYVIRKTKRRAIYWEYFIDYLEAGALRSECKYCDSTFATHGTLNGTKNVKNHFEKCLSIPINFRKSLNASMQSKEGESEDGVNANTNLECKAVDLDDVRKALVRMIIVDELPFKQVEKEGFRDFVVVACPRFHMPSRTTIARDCFQLYMSEKTKLKEMLMTSCQRISVTTDTWTSIQRINYMCLTAHFIDDEWKLHKKIINFCPISSHKGEAIGKVVEACLESWGIESKLFTVRVDNASLNDVACVHLRNMVRRTGCFSDGKFLHVRCIAHIINLIVWDGIRDHGSCIERIRHAVKFVKNSPARLQRFKDLVSKSNIQSKASLSLDVSTRWNSTYLMLDAALKFHSLFGSLSLPDGDDVPDEEQPPKTEDWEKVTRLRVFLRGIYLLTRRISGSKYVTSDKGFFEIAAIYAMLNKRQKSSDKDFQAMAAAMKRKYDKYWGNVEKMNLLVFVAAILDPHSKMMVVEISLIDMYGKEMGTKIANNVKAYTYTLFDEYRSRYSTPIPQIGQSDDLMSIDPSEEDDLAGGAQYATNVKDRAKKMMKTYLNTELDRYMNEVMGENEANMDALTWWSINWRRYPIVSRMARDILAIPLSIVASESAFSTGGRHVNQTRSSLAPKMVQALICTEDWLKGKGASGLEV